MFMMYRETPEGRKPMDMTVVDTGYGLERMTWVSQGKTSAYEAVFGPVVEWLKELCGGRRQTPTCSPSTARSLAPPT